MRISICVIVSLALLVWAMPAAAGDGGYGAVKFYSKSYAKVDVGYYIDKVQNIFFTEEFKQKHPMARMFEAVFNAVGYTAIEGYECQGKMADGIIWEKETIYLNQDYPDSYLYRLAQLPPRDFKFDNFLAKDDYVALMSINNFKEYGVIYVDMLKQVMGAASQMEGGDGDQEMMALMGMMGMMKLDPEFLSSLGSELDFVLFDVPDLQELERGPEGPDFMNAAIMVPVVDYPGAKKLMGMFAPMMGCDLSKPTFNTPDWNFYSIGGSSAAVGLNAEWMVLVTDYKRFAKFAREVPTKFHEKVPCGNFYMRLNVDRLYKELGKPVATMLTAQNPKLAEKEIAYFFDVTPQTDFGEMELRVYCDDDRMLFYSQMDDDVLNLLGYGLCLGLEMFMREKMEEESCKMMCPPETPGGKVPGGDTCGGCADDTRISRGDPRFEGKVCF